MARSLPAAPLRSSSDAGVSGVGSSGVEGCGYVDLGVVASSDEARAWLHGPATSPGEWLRARQADVPVALMGKAP